MESVKSALGLDRSWNVRDGVLSGKMGHLDRSKKPHLQVPISARTLHYGFKVKAKWYHAANVHLEGRSKKKGGGTFLVSVGHWWNKSTNISTPYNHEKRLNVKVTKPKEWNQVEIRIGGSMVGFYYNGRLIEKQVIKDPIRAAEEMTFGFFTHEASIQIKEMFVIVDGRPLTRLKGGTSTPTEVTTRPPTSTTPADTFPVIKTGTEKAKRNQSVIHGLVVRTMSDGHLLGEALEIILTLQPGGTSVIPRFARDVGGDMVTSAGEAARLVNVAHPQWPAGTYTFSFEDKYSGKDGGSAGAAFATLLRSVIEGFEIDDKVAVTGDISVTGKVQKVGGVAAKIHGAIKKKMKIIVIPEDNVDGMLDHVLLYDETPPWKTQVISASRLDRLIAVARYDRSGREAEAIKIFAGIQAMLDDKGEDYLQNEEVAANLKKVVELMPNHETAKYLRLMASGKEPRYLTTKSSLYELFSTTAGLQDLFWADRFITRDYLPKEKVRSITIKLRKLYKIAAKDARPLVIGWIDYIEAVDRATGFGKIGLNNPRYTSLQLRRNRLLAALKKMRTDRALIEKILSEG